MYDQNNIRINPLALYTLGYAIIPVQADKEVLWCVRTRQDINPDVLVTLAPTMVVQDPQTVIPNGQIDLPHAFLVTLNSKGTTRIVKLTDTTKFRTLTFARKKFFGITEDGRLVTTRKVDELMRLNHPDVIKYSEIDMLGLPNDADIKAILTIPTDTGTKLLVGVTTTKTNVWLYEAFIDGKDTRVINLKPVEGKFRQVTGIRLSHDGKAILLATNDDKVWGTAIDDPKYNFRMLYGYHVTRTDEDVPGLGYNTELTTPAPRASRPGNA